MNQNVVFKLLKIQSVMVQVVLSL